MNKYKNIIIVFIVILPYMIFILYIAFLKNNLCNDLISENYYNEEIMYQKTIDEKENANNLINKVKLNTNKKDGIHITFPYKFNIKNTSGKVFLIRFSDKKKDIYEKLFLNKKNEHIILSKYLINGLYKIKIYWKYNEKNFLIEKNFLWKNY